MSKFAGNLFKLSALIDGEFTLICGLQSTSATINAESVDTTDNCSDRFRSILEGAGVRSFTISGSGVTRLPSALVYLLSSHFTQSHIYVKLSDGRGLELYSFMQITAFGGSASHNGAEMFEITLESTREATVYPLGLLAEDGVQLFSEDGESMQPEVI